MNHIPIKQMERRIRQVYAFRNIPINSNHRNDSFVLPTGVKLLSVIYVCSSDI
jgi:hypothetical protein